MTRPCYRLRRFPALKTKLVVIAVVVVVVAAMLTLFKPRRLFLLQTRTTEHSRN